MARRGTFPKRRRISGSPRNWAVTTTPSRRTRLHPGADRGFPGAKDHLTLTKCTGFVARILRPPPDAGWSHTAEAERLFIGVMRCNSNPDGPALGSRSLPDCRRRRCRSVAAQLARFGAACRGARLRALLDGRAPDLPGIASAATAVALAHIAAGTNSIRIGAGGIMLPNHAPLLIAEQFGTLAALHPGRVELGLGRAPGSDQITVRACAEPCSAAPRTFPRKSSN